LQTGKQAGDYRIGLAPRLASGVLNRIKVEASNSSREFRSKSYLTYDSDSCRAYWPPLNEQRL
jgi:hypothetical protein